MAFAGPSPGRRFSSGLRRPGRDDVDQDIEEAPYFSYSVDMLDQLSHKNQLVPDTSVPLHVESKASVEGSVLPGYVIPCPLLVHLKPYLAQPQYQKPPKLGVVLKVRSSATDILADGLSAGGTPGGGSPLRRSITLNVSSELLQAEPVEEQARAEEVGEVDPLLPALDEVTLTPRKKKKRAREEEEFGGGRATLKQQYAPRRATRSESVLKRPAMNDRISLLRPIVNPDPIKTDSARVYILYEPSGKKSAERLLALLSELKHVKPKLPNPSVVATKRPNITHVIVPHMKFQSLLLTFALANGAIRVPPEWVKDTVAASKDAGRTVLADPTQYEGVSYRSKSFLFRRQPYHVMLTDPVEKENIETFLQQCQGIPVGLDDNPKIVVVDDAELPIDPKDPAKYWIRSDFDSLYTNSRLFKKKTS